VRSPQEGGAAAGGGAFLCASKHSEQYTGRSVRGSNGTWAALPQLLQITSCMFAALAAARSAFAFFRHSGAALRLVEETLLLVELLLPRRPHEGIAAFAAGERSVGEGRGHRVGFRAESYAAWSSGGGPTQSFY